MSPLRRVAQLFGLSRLAGVAGVAVAAAAVLVTLGILVIPAEAAAGEETLEKAYLEQRKVAKKATQRAPSDPLGSFARTGCMTDPSQCTCQSEDAKESSACGDVLGYFCVESTKQHLASSCIDLFGGATVCQCASAKQIESHLAAEDAAAKKAAAKKKSSSSSTKKSSSSSKKK